MHTLKNYVVVLIVGALFMFVGTLVVSFGQDRLVFAQEADGGEPGGIGGGPTDGPTDAPADGPTDAPSDKDVDVSSSFGLEPGSVTCANTTDLGAGGPADSIDPSTGIPIITGSSFRAVLSASCDGSPHAKIRVDYVGLSCSDQVDIYYQTTKIDRNGCATNSFFEFRHDAVSPVASVPGVYPVRLNAVSGGRVTETTTGNVSVPDCSSAKPDVVPAAPTYSTMTQLFAGSVTNSAYTAAGSFQNKFEIDYGRDGTVDVTLSGAGTAVVSLAPRGTASLGSAVWTGPAGNHRVRVVADSGRTLDEEREDNNVSAWTDFVIPKPDLISAGLGIAGGATSIVANTPTTLVAQVQNTGSGVAGYFEDRFSYSYGGLGGFFIPISPDVAHVSLAPGAPVTDTAGSFTPTSPGTITVKHCVDEFFSVAESNEGNNCSTQSYTVTSDIMVASCSVDDGDVEVGDPVVWSATATGGSGSYIFTWMSTDGPSGDGNTKTVAYGTTGAKTASVIARDALDLTKTSGAVSCSTFGTSVTVTPSTNPTAELKVRIDSPGSTWTSGPLNITAADQIQLKWDSTNAARCDALAYFDTGRAVRGETSGVGGVEEPTAGSRTYTVVCDGKRDEVTVNFVTSGPGGNPTISANPGRVRAGNTSTVVGTLNGHTGCVITGRDIDPFNSDGDGNPSTRLVGGSGAFGPYVTGPIVGTTPFRLSCASGGSAVATVRVISSEIEI